MVRSWVLVYAGPVNHPLQDYYNLVADETPLSQLKTGVAFGLGNLYLWDIRYLYKQQKMIWNFWNEASTWSHAH